MDNKSQEATDSRLLSKLSNEELLANTRKYAEAERCITVRVLHHLAEIDRRRAYAKLGFSSLWDYATQELKYSESAAYRRISAMRALKAHPELEKKIEGGSLSVTVVSQVQSFLKAEREQAHKTYTSHEKIELFKKCENLSAREVTRELGAISPLALRVQKERPITENRTEISFIVDSDLLGKINRVRDLSVPRLKNPGSYPELVDLMSEVMLDEIDPLRQQERRELRAAPKEGKKSANLPGRPPQQTSDQTAALIAPKATERVGETRHTPASVRAAIWKEFGGRCAFIDTETGRRCGSTFGLEIEHCKPHGIGGSSKDPKNLRLLCRHHNQWTAIQTYGLRKMEIHLEAFKEQKK